MNKVILIGNLGADPSLKFANNGNGILSLRIATTEKFLNKSGEKQEVTDWHSVVIFGKRAEALSKLLNKGDRIAIEGKVRTRSYDDKDGNKRYSTEVIADEVELLGGGKRDGGQQRQSFEQGPGAADSDEIPFGPVDGRLL